MSTWNCQACGAEVPEGSRFCPNCGKEVAVRVCQACGVELPEGSRFCPRCGKEVAAEVPAGKLARRTGPGVRAHPLCSRRLQLTLLALVSVGIAMSVFVLTRGTPPAIVTTPQPTVATPTPTPTPTPPTTSLPPGLRPFTDDAGNSFNLPVAPQRIVSIGPEITEILVALGASEKIVGIDNFSQWPSTRAPIPRLGEPFLLGDWIRPEIGIDTEAVVALRPALVIADTRACARVSTSVPRPPGRILPPFPDLAWAGIPTVRLNPTVGVTGALKLIRSLGEIVGESGKDNQLAASYEKRMRAVVERVQGLPKVRVVLIRWVTSGPPAPGVPVREDHPWSELLQLAGGVNVFTSSPEDKQMAGRLMGEPHALEPYIAKNPEVMLVLFDLGQMQLNRPGWEKVDAVKKGRVYEIGGITPLTVFDRLEEISRLLHPITPAR